jgi:hypothetical protein
MLGGRPAYRSTVKIPFNDCAGLRRGTRDLWLDRRTLLPLRIVERREGRGPSGVRISYRQFGAPFRHGVLDALGAKPFRGDQGFRRTTPNRAASNLGYTPLVPRVLPPGFRLAVSGWAPRSAVNGAEGSIPPARRLFGAVYRFGAERIDLSERLSRGRDWLGDPFGHECIFESRTRVRIAGTPGWFAQGPDNPPHLYWRRGALLYTLTGPLPKRDLLAIAGSLAPAR